MICEARTAWELAFGKHPAEEFYDLKTDPDCLGNLARLPQYRRRQEQLRRVMERELRRKVMRVNSDAARSSITMCMPRRSA
jgi:hypothetical protein